MPQPLSRVIPNGGYRFGSNALHNHPYLCAKVTQAISWAAMTELNWARVLTHLSRGDPRSVYAMHSALSSNEAKSAAVDAVATLNLTPDDYQLMMAIKRSAKAATKTRNEFVHHIWGECPEIPDCLLLIDPAALLRSHVTFAELARGIDDPRYKNEGLYDTSLMMVYRENDLDEAVRRAAQTCVDVAKFAEVIHPDQNSLIDGMRQELLSRPHIRQALDTLSRKATS